jgi:hypothetical protein
MKKNYKHLRMKKDFLLNKEDLWNTIVPLVLNLNTRVNWFIVCFFLGILNQSFSQTFTSTWNLTSDGNATASGAITASSLAIGSGINTPTYSSGDGVTTNGWANDGGSLNTNEYYQYQVTPTTGNKVRVTGVTLNHSVSNGNWIGAVYYSMDGFATAGSQLGSNFNSSSTSQTALNLTGMFSLTIPQGGSFTIRVYAWESDGNNRRFRNRNVVISGTSCVLPSITTQPSSIAVCENSPVTLSVIANNATTYQWKKNNIDLPGETANTLTFANASAANAGTYTVNVSNSCDAVVSSSAVLTVNLKPTAIAISPSAPTVCANAITTLIASGGVATGVTILNENFNGATNNWTLENTSTGGTVADADWKLRPNSYAYDVDVFNSNDNSQFYLSNSDDQGFGSTTSTRLISPVIDLSNCTAASLSFYHYYRIATGDTAKVQISTNGGATWSATDLASYATLQGVDNAFALVTISLNSFVGNNNIKIRFNYSATWDWYWAIDNVTITASKPQITWSPQIGLFTDASANTAYTGQITSIVFAKLTSNSSFTATATNASGCTSFNNVTLTVNPNVTPTFTAVAPICSGGSLSALPTTSNNGITGTWAPALNNSATTTYTFTPTAGQCAITTTLTITVIPNVTPTFTAVAPICSGGSLSALPTTSNNGITGSWAPALNNSATTTYTFTPTAGQCATTTTLTITVIPNVTYYRDFDGDGFGDASTTQLSCTGVPSGYVTNNSDCNDNQLQYLDADSDGFGSTTQVACGVTNNSDCNDNQIQYADIDSDGFGSTTQVACGVTNNSDCNDNQIQYADLDGDGFGSTTQLACGVTNNSDCNDNQIQYADLDGDGFGSTTQVACGVINNSDCNDNQIQYADIDGDGFGSTTQVACGVINNSDCNDNQLQYADIDSDGFGSTTQVACGVINNSDCNDNQLQYADIDSDGFGSTTQVACGVTNNSDCNDNQPQYLDADGDGFGSTTQVACGVTNNSDCNDNQRQYLDFDGDGFGSTTQVGCGVTNNSDCNDNNNLIYQSALLYTDVDDDGYNVGSAVVCYGATLPAGTSLTTLGSGDCNDSNAAINPGAVDVCYDGIDNDCNGVIDNACPAIVSTVQTSQCGVTLPLISSNIFANLVAGAQGYRFKVTDMVTNQVQTIDKVLRVFAITQLGNFAFDRQYKVEVAIRYNNVWQPFYGSPCFVTTPATTSQVQLAQCGSTLTTIGDVIFADNIPYCLGYKFRITNLANSSNSIIVERPTRDVRMNNNLGFTPEFNATYSVEVSVKNTNGIYLPFGSVCNVSTPSFPTTQLQLSQCDVIIGSNATIILADSYSTASQYRFRFVNASQPYSYTFDKSVRSFTLASVPGLLPATTYTVQVALEIGGVFGPFGKVCTITTPGGARTEVGDVTTKFQVVAYPNPFAENFKLNVTISTEEMVNVRVYDMLGNQVENTTIDAYAITELEVGTNYPSGVYNVIVSQGNEVKTLRVIKR